jgi:hypothetical protein
MLKTPFAGMIQIRFYGFDLSPAVGGTPVLSPADNNPLPGNVNLSLGSRRLRYRVLAGYVID